MRILQISRPTPTETFPYIGYYEPARYRTLLFSADRLIRLWLPPTLLIAGADNSVYRVLMHLDEESIENEGTLSLYPLPLPNIDKAGSVCLGNTEYEHSPPNRVWLSKFTGGGWYVPYSDWKEASPEKVMTMLRNAIKQWEISPIVRRYKYDPEFERQILGKYKIKNSLLTKEKSSS